MTDPDCLVQMAMLIRLKLTPPEDLASTGNILSRSPDTALERGSIHFLCNNFTLQRNVFRAPKHLRIMNYDEISLVIVLNHFLRDWRVSPEAILGMKFPPFVSLINDEAPLRSIRHHHRHCFPGGQDKKERFAPRPAAQKRCRHFVASIPRPAASV